MITVLIFAAIGIYITYRNNLGILGIFPGIVFGVLIATFIPTKECEVENETKIISLLPESQDSCFVVGSGYLDDKLVYVVRHIDNNGVPHKIILNAEDTLIVPLRGEGYPVMVEVELEAEKHWLNLFGIPDHGVKLHILKLPVTYELKRRVIGWEQ